MSIYHGICSTRTNPLAPLYAACHVTVLRVSKTSVVGCAMLRRSLLDKSIRLVFEIHWFRLCTCLTLLLGTLVGRLISIAQSAKVVPLTSHADEERGEMHNDRGCRLTRCKDTLVPSSNNESRAGFFGTVNNGRGSSASC